MGVEARHDVVHQQDAGGKLVGGVRSRTGRQVTSLESGRGDNDVRTGMVSLCEFLILNGRNG
jgi:hypothetical protein